MACSRCSASNYALPGPRSSLAAVCNGALQHTRTVRIAQRGAAAAALPRVLEHAVVVRQQALDQQPSKVPPQQQPCQLNAATDSSSLWSRLNWELLLLLAAAAPVPAALADEGLRYDASRGEGIVKTLSGAAYIGLLLYFLFKVLNRRARKAREERLAGQGPISTVFTKLIERITEGKPQPQATPAAAFIGALQAGLIGFGLFVFSSRVEGLVYGQDLPTGYTARNIAITVRTVIVGLLYLATFTFSANAVGLTGLGVQLLLFPDSLPDEAPARRTPQEPALPKVTVTSTPDEIRKAFQAVAQVKQGGAGSNSGSSSSSAAAAGGSNGSTGGSSAPSPAGTQATAAGSAPAAAAAASGAGSSSEEA